tara:strand:+ start:536 stop:661 length:126 start_codon:yes stop_codon:yes gene_type:complete
MLPLAQISPSMKRLNKRGVLRRFKGIIVLGGVWLGRLSNAG